MLSDRNFLLGFPLETDVLRASEVGRASQRDNVWGYILNTATDLQIQRPLKQIDQQKLVGYVLLNWRICV
jgi:hypothetical protein